MATLIDYLNGIKNEALKTGGTVFEFITGNVRRAQEFLGSKWRILTQEYEELKNVKSVDVILQIRELDDKTYQYLSDNWMRIMWKISYVLTYLGVG